VQRVEDELSLRDRLLLDLLSTATARWGTAGPAAGSRSPLAALGRLLERQVRLLGQLNDPAGLYAHCLCEVE
jgi:hypothetical protein